MIIQSNNWITVFNDLKILENIEKNEEKKEKKEICLNLIRLD